MTPVKKTPGSVAGTGSHASYAACYAVEYFKLKTMPSYALWAIACKEPTTNRYHKIPDSYGRTDTLEEAHLGLTSWCEDRGLTMDRLTQGVIPWRLVKDLLAGKEAGEFFARRSVRKALVRRGQVSQSLVEIRGQAAFTTSLELATGASLTHEAVIKTLRKYQTDFEEFGKVRFEIRLNAQGSPTEYALLNEDQSTFLLALSRNTATVVRFKKRLVKEFRKALTEIARLYANPPRADLLLDKRAAHNPMMNALVEWRESQGKTTETHHFTNENLLCNWAVTGVRAPIDEKALSNEDAALLEKVRRRNESFLIRASLRRA